MKKRLRQVQLEMTKLRARQAEVSKEVQNAPISGVRPLPVQPSQEDINARSIFVSNVHFAATKAALNVHFGDCGEIVRVTLLGDVATGKPKGYSNLLILFLPCNTN
jgi:RNA recognition motif-containing protein